MFRKYILPLLAVLGLGLGIFIAARANRTVPPVRRSPQRRNHHIGHLSPGRES